LRSVREIKAEYDCGITRIAHLQGTPRNHSGRRIPAKRISEAVVCVLACATGDLLKYELN
jgi:hypothetical protein